MTETKNAVIIDAWIGIEGHGFMTASIRIVYGVAVQSFGGWALGDEIGKPCIAGHFVRRCLEVVGVERFDKLIGKNVRARADWGKVHAIGNILRDTWFDPSVEYKYVK